LKFPLPLLFFSDHFQIQIKSMNIYVSNLGFSVDREELKKLFSPYGIVASVSIILDKLTNRSRGFAFVQMPNEDAAQKAMRELNGAVVDGRPMRLSEAKRNERFS
jgi:RNA recognition motif-containing protein